MHAQTLPAPWRLRLAVIGAAIGAARAGAAAGFGFILAIAAKIGIAFTMLGVFAVAWIS